MDLPPLEIIRKLSRPSKPEASALQPVLPPISGIKAVVFDIYGTLFSSSCGDLQSSPGRQAENLLLSILRDYDISHPAGLTPLTTRLHDLIKREHEEARAEGNPYPEIEIRNLWGKLLALPPGPMIESIALRYECGVNPVWPMPGAGDLLASLRHKGLALGLISNAQFYSPMLFPALLGLDLPELGFASDLCIYSYQHGIAKPDPGLYEILRVRLKQHGIEPGETLYLGNDALKDIDPAARLGFHTALFAGDSRSLRLHPGRDDLLPPKATLTNLNQVDGLLDSANS
ncbi:MAG: HAD family hydrolase [Verrucomicrobiota bacterium]|nr:HAD family hydrolase [Verrucomicrobiota bacterium]